MKHLPILFVFAMAVAGVTRVSAQQIRITLPDDNVVKGEFVSATDSTITYTDKSGKECVAQPMFVYSVYIKGVGSFKSTGGRFLSSSGLTINDVLLAQSTEAAEKQAQEELRNAPIQTQALVSMQRQIEELMQLQAQAAEKAQQQVYPSNGADYTLIGKAFKTTGTVSLSIGVPCLAAGIACCTAGNVGGNRYNLIARAQCLEASYYLFGIGASLTIVGIPLYVQGKKIMDINITYTGNGAGVAVSF